MVQLDKASKEFNSHPGIEVIPVPAPVNSIAGRALSSVHRQLEDIQVLILSHNQINVCVYWNGARKDP
jgi:hypothetical protein